MTMAARELRQLRDRLGLTQHEMAKALGVTQQTYSKWENGRHGRDYHLDPDRPIPEEVAERARKIQPARVSRYRLTEEEFRIRECIERQVCPFCGRGGWKLLARHTREIHGVDARTLREMAALPLHVPICSPDHSERLRQVQRERLRELAPEAAAAQAEQRRGSRMPHSRGGVVSRAKANRRRVGE